MIRPFTSPTPALPQSAVAAPARPVKREGVGIWLLAVFAALIVAGGIVFPKAGVAGIAAIVMLTIAWRIVKYPFTGILAAFWIFPLYPAFRAAYFAYGIPIAVAGSRPWCEALMSLLFAGLLIAGSRDRAMRLKLTWEDLPVMAYFLSGVYATVIDMAAHLSPLAPFFGWELSLVPTLFYIAMRWIRPTEAERRALMRTLILTYVLTAILSLLDYFVRNRVGIALADATRPYLAEQSGMTVEKYWRIYPRLQSILFEENVWGTLCTFFALYCLSTRAFWETTKGRVSAATRWYWLLFLLAACSLLLSMSRGAMICFSVGVFVLLLMRGRHRLRIAIAVGVAALLAVSLLIHYANDHRVAFLMRRADTVSVDSAKKGEIANDRAFQWIHGWEIFVRTPSGTGLGTIGYAAFLSKTGGLVVADGIYFRVLAEEGVPGELLFLFALVGIGYVLARCLRRATGWNRVLGMALLAFHCGFCVQSIGANTFDYYYFPSVYWVLFGLFITQVEGKRPLPPPIRGPIPEPRWRTLLRKGSHETLSRLRSLRRGSRR